MERGPRFKVHQIAEALTRSADPRSTAARALEPDSRTVSNQVDWHKRLLDEAGSEAMGDLFDLQALRTHVGLVNGEMAWRAWRPQADDPCTTSKAIGGGWPSTA